MAKTKRKAKGAQDKPTQAEPVASHFDCAKLVARMKKMPEEMGELPTSLVTEYPGLSSIWVRPCPFCDSHGLAQQLSTILSCGRAHGITYKKLASLLEVYAEELNATA